MHGDSIFEGHSSFFKNQTDVIESLPDLSLELSRDLPRLQIASGLPGHVQRVTYENAWAKRPASGKFLGLDYLLGRRE